MLSVKCEIESSRRFVRSVCFHESNTHRKVLIRSIGNAFVQKMVDRGMPSFRSTKNGTMVLATTATALMNEMSTLLNTKPSIVSCFVKGINLMYRSKGSMK